MPYEPQSEHLEPRFNPDQHRRMEILLALVLLVLITFVALSLWR